MIKLKYIGRQPLPKGLVLDSRLWNIEATELPGVKPFIGSTRTIEGLQELGVIPFDLKGVR